MTSLFDALPTSEETDGKHEQYAAMPSRGENKRK